MSSMTPPRAHFACVEPGSPNVLNANLAGLKGPLSPSLDLDGRSPPRADEMDLMDEIADDQGEALEALSALLVEERRNNERVTAALSDRLCASAREVEALQGQVRALAIKTETERLDAEAERQRADVTLSQFYIQFLRTCACASFLSIIPWRPPGRR